jgi:hypothetical protein
MYLLFLALLIIPVVHAFQPGDLVPLYNDSIVDYYPKGFLEFYCGTTTTPYCQSWLTLPGFQMLSGGLQTAAYVAGLLYTLTGLHLTMKHINSRVLPKILGGKTTRSHKLSKDQVLQLVEEKWESMVTQMVIVAVVNSLPVFLLNLIEKVGQAIEESPRVSPSKWDQGEMIALGSSLVLSLIVTGMSFFVIKEKPLHLQETTT